jgi:hypothetical protein
VELAGRANSSDVKPDRLRPVRLTFFEDFILEHSLNRVHITSIRIAGTFWTTPHVRNDYGLLTSVHFQGPDPQERSTDFASTLWMQRAEWFSTGRIGSPFLMGDFMGDFGIWVSLQRHLYLIDINTFRRSALVDDFRTFLLHPGT